MSKFERCENHRRRNGLILIAETEPTQCAIECEIQETCPLNPVNKVI